MTFYSGSEDFTEKFITNRPVPDETHTIAPTGLSPYFYCTTCGQSGSSEQDIRWRVCSKPKSLGEQYAESIPEGVLMFDDSGDAINGPIRQVDPDTGGEKESKLARYDLIPTGPLNLLATHYGLGAKKYSDRNWEKGYKWGLSYAALHRHLNAFWSGEDYDEDGHFHLAAAAFHVFALMHFAYSSDPDGVYSARDDRP